MFRRSSLLFLLATILLSVSPAEAQSSANSLYAWGSNASGQLGNGAAPISVTPGRVSGLGSGSGIVAITAGGSHSLALKNDGTVLAWGLNANGQLGDGTTTQRLTPVQVSALGSGSGIVAIAAGGSHSLALKQDGTVFAWGANANGQLGDGTTTQRLTPVPVSSLGAGSGVAALAVGSASSVARKTDGTVLAWGGNAQGQLGDGTTTTRLTPVQVSGLGTGSGVVAIAAGFGGHALGLKSDGTVLAWGANNVGQLGDGTSTARLTPVPVSGLGAGSGVVTLAAAQAQSEALKADGSVLAWGANAAGQLGDGTTTTRLTPVPVSGLGAGSGIVALAAANSHTLALSSAAAAFAWGLNASGQLGDGTLASGLTPVRISNLGLDIVALAAGANHSLALRTDGTVLGWGGNDSGQVGDGTDPNSLTLAQVSGLASGSSVVSVAAGDSHSVALRADGTVLAWGANAQGQLGDGTTTTRLAPVQVSGLGAGSGVVAIAAASAHSLALRSDGAVLAWGGNPNGQLGDGTTTNRLTATPVTGLGAGSGVVAIGANGGVSLALKADGTVLGWGGNAFGQLGDGTTTNRLTPVQVTGLGAGSGVVAIADGGARSLALKADGTVLAWGFNNNGQLGDGTTSQRLMPVQVSGLGAGSGVVAVAAPFGGHSLALKADGTVLAWGLNSNGQLGDGTTTQRLTPVPVSGLGAGSGVVAIAGGANYSLALKADGTVRAWGFNAGWQLGDGTTIERLIPVQVRHPSGSGFLTSVLAIEAGSVHNLAVTGAGQPLAPRTGNAGLAGRASTPPATVWLIAGAVVGVMLTARAVIVRSRRW